MLVFNVKHLQDTIDTEFKLLCLFMTSFEKMSWFEYWKHAFLKVIRMSSKVLYQHCMLSRCVGIVFWMQKNQRNSSNGQFHCFHYVRKRAPCWNDLFLMETRETKTHFSQCFPPVWPKRGIPWESWRPEDSENVVVFKFWMFLTRVIGCQSRVKF